MTLTGISQGAQPIMAYNFGANKLKRVNETIIYGYIIVLFISLFFVSIFNIFPEQLLSLFIEPTSPTMPIAVNGLRLFTISGLFIGFLFLNIAYFQSTNHNKTATILNILRTTVFLVPPLIILPKLFGLNGVWLALPAVDIITTLISSIFLYIYIKENKTKIKEENKILNQ